MDRETLAVIGYVINGLIVLFIWLLKTQFGSIVKRVDQLEGHIEEIRGNYLDRFDELRQLLADIRVEQTKIKGCVEKIQSICALQHKMFTKKDE